jgi:hypothetical protein
MGICTDGAYILMGHIYQWAYILFISLPSSGRFFKNLTLYYSYTEKKLDELYLTRSLLQGKHTPSRVQNQSAIAVSSENHNKHTNSLGMQTFELGGT